MIAEFYGRYFTNIGRPIILSIINWARTRHFRLYNTSCEEWEDPDELPLCSKDVSIIQLLELVPEHLRRKVGVRKIPLSYMTRADPIVPTIGTISATLPYYEGVYSFHEKLIARASHKHPNSAEDNGMILDVLFACLKIRDICQT